MTTTKSAGTGFLQVPEVTADLQRRYDAEASDLGYVMNLSRVWAHSPEARDQAFGLMDHAAALASLTFRQRGILITALASTLGDSYCSLAWGKKLSGEAGPEVAAASLVGDESRLDATDAALARWARAVARDPSATTPPDVDLLRGAGFIDTQIFGVTLFVAIRLAFSTVNGALGARPDAELKSSAPPEVLEAVTFGRPIAD